MMIQAAACSLWAVVCCGQSGTGVSANGVSGNAAAVVDPQSPRQLNASIIENVLREPPHDGLLIFEVLPKLQGEKAGLRVGDIITEYDGQAVRTTSQLQKIARAAASDNRGQLPILARRGRQVIEAQFDTAPLGVRLVAVAKGIRRTLWRPATDFQPNKAPIYNAVKNQHRWDFIQFADKNVGWVHSYYTSAANNQMILRTQSATVSEKFSEKRDLIVTFDPESPTLAVSTYRLMSKDKLTLDFHAREGVLVGARNGVRDSAPLPKDCISADLAGLVACTMPRDKGACRRCSFLEAGAVVAAPYADLYCLGEETITVGHRKLNAFRFDQTVFGRSVAHYWVDSNGELMQTRFGNGFTIVRTNSTDVKLAFPASGNDFPPIEKLPALTPPERTMAQ